MKKSAKQAVPAVKKQRVSKGDYVFVKASVLPLFEQGKKLEVRVLSQYMRRFKVGHLMRISDGKKEITRKIVAIRDYVSFSAMLGKEDFKLIYPSAESKEEMLKLLGKLYVNSLESHKIRVYELAKP